MQKVTCIDLQLVTIMRYKWGTNKIIKNLFSFSLGFTSRYKTTNFFIIILEIESDRVGGQQIRHQRKLCIL